MYIRSVNKECLIDVKNVRSYDYRSVVCESYNGHIIATTKGHFVYAITYVSNAYYFNGLKMDSEMTESVKVINSSLYSDSQELPVPEENLNTFIITNENTILDLSQIQCPRQ